MATNKKRKKTQTSHHTMVIPIKLSKTFLDTCYATARRVFQAMGEDPAGFDLFSKRQKQDMFRVMIMPPRLAAMPGHKVPRQYLRFIQEQLFMFLKMERFNEKTDLTWMDMITVGQTIMMIFRLDTFVDSLPPPQREVADRMNKAFKEQMFNYETQLKIASHVRTLLIMLSQPNFRIYGQSPDEHLPSSRRPAMQQVIRITTHESQSLRFNYRNRERTAFRVALGQYKELPYQPATIAMSKIIPGIKRDRQLNIYIQSHAIHRFKERIDTFFPFLRNQYFVLSLLMAQIVVRAPGGMQLIACITPHEESEKTIGYFAFTIDGDNLLVLTLLPLLSRSVPEGRVLYERLRLSADDIKYLGMDKLSFFYDVDIAQIPALKKVLFDELHLDYMRVLRNCYRTKDAPFDERKTLFVKNFFQKLEEQPSDYTEAFDDLADLDL